MRFGTSEPHVQLRQHADQPPVWTSLSLEGAPWRPERATSGDSQGRACNITGKMHFRKNRTRRDHRRVKSDPREERFRGDCPKFWIKSDAEDNGFFYFCLRHKLATALKIASRCRLLLRQKRFKIAFRVWNVNRSHSDGTEGVVAMETKTLKQIPGASERRPSGHMTETHPFWKLLKATVRLFQYG